MPNPLKKRGRPPGTGRKTEEVRQEILQTFARLTSRHGITAISLSHLASELGMSLATIYKHFANKEELVDATVSEWVDRFRATNVVLENYEGVTSSPEGLHIWATGWAKQLEEFSVLFWQDMKNNYPLVWEKFNATLMDSHSQGRALLEPFVRDDINHDLAFELFLLLFNHAANPEVAQRYGLTRLQAVETVARLWASGALESKENFNSTDS